MKITKDDIDKLFKNRKIVSVVSSFDKSSNRYSQSANIETNQSQYYSFNI